MSLIDDLAWFKAEFGAMIAARIRAPLSIDLFTAIACQETGEIWRALRTKGLSTEEILSLCVGDTLDDTSNPPRQAFPRSKKELTEAPQGTEMFAIARDALVRMSAQVAGYASTVKKPNKFCHGFGLFQRDLQFYRTDPQYFLSRSYESFASTLDHAALEFERLLVRKEWTGRSSLSDMEFAELAIRYNTGRYDPKRGLMQGYRDDQGIYYGQHFAEFLRMARLATPGVLTPPADTAPLAPPTPVTADGGAYLVDTTTGTLLVRRTPKKEKDNVIVGLPDGHPVVAVEAGLSNGYRHIQTQLHGALVDGWVANAFLDPVPAPQKAVVVAPVFATPAAVAVSGQIPRVELPNPKNRPVTRASSDSRVLMLNESAMPRRQGATPIELADSLGAIVSWLRVDRASSKRYQPADSKTYCNIYAYDYCCLSGVYLPRVWWSSPALVRIAAGEQVAVKYADTVDEVRANDLFKWLKNYGPSFGWRMTTSLNELQTEANHGAVCLMVAKRKEEGKSGHICPVVPEIEGFRAKRDATGRITAPVLSQAGATNFQYGYGTKNWWLSDKFSEFAFWMHA